MDRTILSDQNCSEITLLRIIPTDSLGCSYPLHQPKDRIVVHVRQMPQTFVCFCQVYSQSIPTGTRALSDVFLQEFLEWQLNRFPGPPALLCPNRSCFYRLSLNWSEKKILSQTDTTCSKAVTIRYVWTQKSHSVIESFERSMGKIDHQNHTLRRCEPSRVFAY